MSTKKTIKPVISETKSDVSESDEESDINDTKDDGELVENDDDISDDDEENDVIEATNVEENDEEIQDTELKEGDTKAELENCYYQYDNLIDEYEELGPATRVPDEDRITLNRLTKYEMVRVLGIRAQQISVGAKCLVKNIENRRPIEIAIYELRQKMTPFKLKRPLPNNTYEIWKIKELEIELSENEEKSLVNSIN